MSEYETVPIELQFECTHAVYKKNSNSSLCYVTSKERGEFIEKALKAQKRVEELEEAFFSLYQDYCPYHNFNGNKCTANATDRLCSQDCKEFEVRKALIKETGE